MTEAEADESASLCAISAAVVLLRQKTNRQSAISIAIPELIGATGSTIVCASMKALDCYEPHEVVHRQPGWINADM